MPRPLAPGHKWVMEHSSLYHQFLDDWEDTCTRPESRIKIPDPKQGVSYPCRVSQMLHLYLSVYLYISSTKLCIHLLLAHIWFPSFMKPTTLSTHPMGSPPGPWTWPACIRSMVFLGVLFGQCLLAIPDCGFFPVLSLRCMEDNEKTQGTHGLLVLSVLRSVGKFAFFSSSFRIHTNRLDQALHGFQQTKALSLGPHSLPPPPPPLSSSLEKLNAAKRMHCFS